LAVRNAARGYARHKLECGPYRPRGLASWIEYLGRGVLSQALESLIGEASGLTEQVAFGRVGRPNQHRGAGLLARERGAVEHMLVRDLFHSA